MNLSYAFGKPYRILVIGPLPPGLIGGIASFIESQLANPALNEQFRMFCLDISLSPGLRRNPLTRFFGSLTIGGRLLWMLAARRPQIVHIHSSAFMSFWEKGVLVLICRLFGRRVLLHMHGSDFDSFSLQSRLKPLLRFMLNRTDVIIVLSAYWKDFFGSFTTTRLEILPNCPRTIFFRETCRAGEGSSVLFIGSVGPRKGVDVLLGAVKLLRARGFGNPVVLAGGDERPGDIERYRQQAEMDRLGEVVFRGNVSAEGLVGLLSEAAIFCLPSRGEGLPIAMLEAMAMGVPVVATPVGGIADTLEDGINGYIVPVGDSETLAGRLETLLRDAELRIKIGRVNFAKARTGYHPEITGAALAEIYYSLTT